VNFLAGRVMMLVAINDQLAAEVVEAIRAEHRGDATAYANLLADRLELLVRHLRGERPAGQAS
jgi:hypothetical protein